MAVTVPRLATALNESPSEKEGKFFKAQLSRKPVALNESPSEKEGKFARSGIGAAGARGPQ